MKLVILAGGFGTRLSEQTDLIPKPMVEIGGKPILWHIMKLYACHGINEFVVALGYKGSVIKDYFLNYQAIESDCTIDLSTGAVEIFPNHGKDDWRVTLVDTGQDVMTGGRIKRLREFIQDETFMLTYGDGVADVNVTALKNFHCQQGVKATLTAVHPKAHYGELELNGNRIVKFMEKPRFRQSWINGGFMVLDPSVIDLIEGDHVVFEREPLERLSAEGQLTAYQHNGFWQCMDTLRDVRYLNSLWDSNDAPWRLW
jgi:glucose-1-phosphate cytidylyltransferase